ncbi:hypothetical protein GCM10010483_32590 [Actinokineospora diospyrosa]
MSKTLGANHRTASLGENPNSASVNSVGRWRSGSATGPASPTGSKILTTTPHPQADPNGHTPPHHHLPPKSPLDTRGSQCRTSPPGRPPDTQTRRRQPTPQVRPDPPTQPLDTRKFRCHPSPLSAALPTQPRAVGVAGARCSMGWTCFVWGDGTRSVSARQGLLLGPCFAVLPRVS